eukprot:gene562-8072_t
MEHKKEHEFKKFPIYKAFWKLSELENEAGNVDDSMNYLKKSYENCKDFRRKAHLNITKASLIRQQNESEKAQELILSSLSIIRNQKIDENEIYLAQGYQELGNIFEKKDPKKSLEFFEKAFTILETYIGFKHENTTKSAIQLGKVLVQQEKETYAIHILEKALVAAEILNLSVEQISNAGLYLGKAYSSLKKFQLQRTTLTRVIRIAKEKVEEEGESISSKISLYKLENMLAICRLFLGDFKEAFFIFKTLASAEEKLMPEWRNLNENEVQIELSARYFFSGISLFELGDFENSKKNFMLAKKIYKKIGNEKFKNHCDEYLTKIIDQ